MTDSETQADTGYTSTIPWTDAPADCVVICCSDPRFEKQHEEFVGTLGFSQPHFIQVPSGAAVLASAVAAADSLPEAMGLLLNKAIDLTRVRTVICIGHEDCGGYRAGKVEIVQAAAEPSSRKSIREIQHDHLREAGREVARRLGADVEVRVYYADVVRGPGADRVRFVDVAT